MQIFMTADSVGGVWNFSLQLARELLKRGHSVILASMGSPLSPAQRDSAAALEGLEHHHRPYRLPWMADSATDVERAAAWLQTLAAGASPHVVHLNDWAHADLSWPAPVLVTGHSCPLSWWKAVRGGPLPLEGERSRRRNGRALRSADVVVAPTHAMLSALRSLYGPLPARRVIHNGRAPADYVAVGRKEPLILAVGRIWDDGKNLETLAEVAPRLPWPVEMVGPTHHPDGGRVEWPGVTFTGPLPAREVARRYARASILAHPARYEPFGLSALEAALSGCALVLGNIPSLREVWGSAAWFVDPDDPQELQEAITGLAMDTALRRDFAQMARTRALHYRPERMVAGYLEVYRELAAGPRSPTRSRPHFRSNSSGGNAS